MPAHVPVGSVFYFLPHFLMAHVPPRAKRPVRKQDATSSANSLADVLPRLKIQEISYDDPASSLRFEPSVASPFVMTQAVAITYGPVVIRQCLEKLRRLAQEYDGIDYLQVFEDRTDRKREPLWFIDDGKGGAITPLLASDY
ncbi:hypothetical protein [Thalassoroseus pseudoceratinae]|uniref:hypothetical protein n=1 Tax=Thalassoroseus pseudoceratinae TaxID=2713176 RepID=UPI00142422A9|nr:hypothetical protein [Thalassoroseus pseudoceratinae]